MARGPSFEFTGLRDFILQVDRSENYQLPDVVRSGIRHDLLDVAEQLGDDLVWDEIAQAIVRACDEDDLTPQVSDHFVRAAPDHIFRKVAMGSPHDRFTRWRRRAYELGQKDKEEGEGSQH
jgi:16S rRNA C1402 N4-methylase RsmH